MQRPGASQRVIGIVSALVSAGVIGLMLLALLGLLGRGPAPVPPAATTASGTPAAAAGTNTATPRQLSAAPTAQPTTAAPLEIQETADAPSPAATQGTSPTPTSTNAAAVETPQANAPERECPPPEGWALHYVQPGETLFAYVLGSGGTTTTAALREANCLSDNLLLVGQPLYLPPGAAENAPSSEPQAAIANPTGPRLPACDPHCTISIRPGWRAEQIAAAVDQVPVGFWGAEFLAAVGPGTSAGIDEFLPTGRALEGFLYPGTYELSSAHSAEDFRAVLVGAFTAALPADAAASAAAHGLTVYEVVTLASVIQRESWSFQEQVLISSVFHNRLRVGNPLGASATLQYALGRPGNWWPRILNSQVDTPSPYNTFTNSGLPPGPIANPGSDAIRAALQPADTSYFYFTGNCQGPGNLYAETFEEHLANVNACG